MYTGTRLTTAIHRRLFSRFFLREGGRLDTGYSVKIFLVCTWHQHKLKTRCAPCWEITNPRVFIRRNQNSASLIMPHLCAVYGCSHNSKREKGLFKFFGFPSVIWNQGEETRKQTEKRRRRWLANVNRADLDAKKLDHYHFCSNHFISGKTNFQIIEYNDRFKIH